MALRNLIAPIPLTYIGKKKISTEVYSFRFSPLKNFTWQAGQHGLLEITDKKGKKLRKLFSLSSAPSENEITITTRTIKDSPSEFKVALMKLKKGQQIKFRGPIGPLVIKNPAKTYAFFATGIGITPFRSIIIEAAGQKLDTNIYLFYAGNKSHHFFKEEFAAAKKQLPNLTITYVYKPERIRGHLVEEVMGDEVKSALFFLAGSKQMVKSYKRTLHGLGVTNRHIKSDAFLGYTPGPSHLKN
jgi:ferredoxin-NADP reductase